jgi:predicted Zn-dependent protease
MSSRLETVLSLADENPDEPMPQIMAGNELLNAGEPARALAYLDRYVALLPGGDVGAAYRMKGRAHHLLGEAEAAQLAFGSGLASALAHGHGDLAQAIREEMQGA